MILHSEQLDQLYTALSQAQAEFPLIGKSRAAHYGNYADLSDMLNPIWPVLKKYGLSVYDFTSVDTTGLLFINVRLAHSSGQYTTTQCLFRDGLSKDADWGGCLTFRRRYMYRSILGIAIPNDIDDNDDGHATKQPIITIKQAAKILALDEDTIKKILDHYKVNSVSQLYESEYKQIAKKYNWAD